jgi:hypothetical protein
MNRSSEFTGIDKMNRIRGKQIAPAGILLYTE